MFLELKSTYPFILSHKKIQQQEQKLLNILINISFAAVPPLIQVIILIFCPRSPK